MANTLLLMLGTLVVVECSHTFIGTSVQQTLVFHLDLQYAPKVFKKRVEDLYYIMPQIPANEGRTIQGILAYDMTHTGASVNVTQGGLGATFVNVRVKSDYGTKLHFDIYIYA